MDVCCIGPARFCFAQGHILHSPPLQSSSHPNLIPMPAALRLAGAAACVARSGVACPLHLTLPRSNSTQHHLRRIVLYFLCPRRSCPRHVLVLGVWRRDMLEGKFWSSTPPQKCLATHGSCMPGPPSTEKVQNFQSALRRRKMYFFSGRAASSSLVRSQVFEAPHPTPTFNAPRPATPHQSPPPCPVIVHQWLPTPAQLACTCRANSCLRLGEQVQWAQLRVFFRRPATP